MDQPASLLTIFMKSGVGNIIIIIVIVIFFFAPQIGEYVLTGFASSLSPTFDY